MGIKDQFSKYRKQIRLFWIVFAGGIGAFALFILLLSWGVFGALPGFDELENPQNSLATQLISSDG